MSSMQKRCVPIVIKRMAHTYKPAVQYANPKIPRSICESLLAPVFVVLMPSSTSQLPPSQAPQTQYLSTLSHKKAPVSIMNANLSQSSGKPAPMSQNPKPSTMFSDTLLEMMYHIENGSCREAEGNGLLGKDLTAGRPMAPVLLATS